MSKRSVCIALITLLLTLFPLHSVSAWEETAFPIPPSILQQILSSFSSAPPESPPEPPSPKPPDPITPVTGTVSLGENAPDALTREQLSLIEDYFFYYFQSLALLEPQDVSILFAPDGASQAQAALHTATFELLTESRKMQPTDLSLTKCTYEIVIGTQRLRENGDLMVYATEENTQNFAGYPGVDARTLSMGHAFYMKETPEGWRLTKHWQNEDFHLLVSGLFGWGVRDENLKTDAEASRKLAKSIVDRILAEARQNLSRRQEQRLTYRGKTEPVRTWDHDYDRAAALEYASRWIGERSPQWPAYDIYGGNCQNFASQVLLAGGIPMDITGSAQWKWYGEVPSTANAPWGRSASWAGVGEFYQYAEQNQGFGLTCDLTGSYFDADPGDLLQFGALGEWKHTAVISRVVRDEEGNFLDYLIDSNTADRIDYPAAAYPYSDHRLIRVLGWSE